MSWLASFPASTLRVFVVSGVEPAIKEFTQTADVLTIQGFITPVGVLMAAGFSSAGFHPLDFSLPLVIILYTKAWV